MFSFVSISALLLVSTVFGDGNVQVLTEENFDEIVGGSDRVLVEFYAPWCGHCKALAPEYEKAADKLKELDAVTILAKVDATENKDLASKYGVRGYPTLKYFSGGDIENPKEYGGGRTEDTIVSWITKREQPAVSDVTSDDELNQFKAKNPVALVAFTNDEAVIKTITSISDSLREQLSFGIYKDSSGSYAGKVVLFRNFDTKEVVFDGAVTEESLKAFVEGERFPLFGEISQQNFRDYVDRGLPLVWVAVEDATDADALETITNAVNPAAVANKGKLSFVYIDNNKFAQHIGTLGITSVPGAIVVQGNDKWLFDGTITDESSVTAWFDRYSKGEIGKFLKSEPIPESNDDPVFVLVGQEFDTVVGKGKDVFVEFYAPWCGHCKKLAPEYEIVGSNFKEVNDVVIAKIDATANDTPEEIRGFPTLIFYPAGSTVPNGVKYQGARTAEAITSWIKEHATVDVSAAKSDDSDDEPKEEL